MVTLALLPPTLTLLPALFRVASTPIGNTDRPKRYGLGIRRFRSSNNATDAAAREAAAVTAGGAGAGAGAGAAAAPSSVAAAAAAAAAVANGGTSGSKRGEHDLGGGGSVAQCFEQVPVMFFDKDFSLQVCVGGG